MKYSQSLTIFTLALILSSAMINSLSKSNEKTKQYNSNINNNIIGNQIVSQPQVAQNVINENIVPSNGAQSSIYTANDKVISASHQNQVSVGSQNQKQTNPTPVYANTNSIYAQPNVNAIGVHKSNRIPTHKKSRQTPRRQNKGNKRQRRHANRQTYVQTQPMMRNNNINHNNAQVQSVQKPIPQSTQPIQSALPRADQLPTYQVNSKLPHGPSSSSIPSHRHNHHNHNHTHHNYHSHHTNSTQSSSCSKNRFNHHDQSFNIHDKIERFSTGLAKYFKDIAAFGYCEQDLMIHNKCCHKNFEADWSFVASESISLDNFNVGILRSDAHQKIVITATGIRRKMPVVPDAVKTARLVPFENSSTIQVQDYFQALYDQIKVRVFPLLQRLYKEVPHYQFIFVGHSTGGSMASVIALGALRNNIIIRNVYSPALITYGQPRTGNDVFANEIMLNVQIVFRIVRQGDAMATYPHCRFDHTINQCASQLKNNKFEQATSIPT
jgi:hypothetical protein